MRITHKRGEAVEIIERYEIEHGKKIISVTRVMSPSYLDVFATVKGKFIDMSEIKGLEELIENQNLEVGEWYGCEDCGALASVVKSAYGENGYMAEITCPNCGTSYDTNMEEE